MQVGLDRVAQGTVTKELRGSRVGLLTHAAAVDRHLELAIGVLRRAGASPAVLFGPEHGLYATAQDMAPVAGESFAGIPVVSLYGETADALVMTEADAERFDVLVMDMQDVGSRYYTFVWTALLNAEQAIRCGKRVLILDRPNPIDGQTVEGDVQENFSFVGLREIAVRHGLTLGEIVALFIGRSGVSVGAGGQLQVVATLGWDRSQEASSWDRAFVMPSPNMPTLETARVYPGGCLLEGTNLSEGRGTTRPFELFGAPWLDVPRWFATARAAYEFPGCVLRETLFRPTFHKYAGMVCQGVQVHVTDPTQFAPMRAYLTLIAAAQRNHPSEFCFRTEKYEYVDNIPAIDLLAGKAVFREGAVRGDPLRELVELIARPSERAIAIYREGLTWGQRASV